jgi:selenophosphate synthetase-related protein
MDRMDMTGWLQGQVFVQTVDEKEVEAVTGFLKERGLTFQVLTLSERMVLDDGDPSSTVTSDRFSIAIQLGGFPQVLAPVLSDLVQRVHGGGWEIEPAEKPDS